jgi:hypothetical protein
MPRNTPRVLTSMTRSKSSGSVSAEVVRGILLPAGALGPPSRANLSITAVKIPAFACRASTRPKRSTAAAK